MEFVHYSVMKEECLTGLNLKEDGIYFDGTLGGAGHSFEILKRTSPNGRLIATDLDTEAIKNAHEKLKEFNGRYQIFNTNFKNIKEVLKNAEIDKLDGAILDLGVSSYQLDNRSRGFSYMSEDVRLDMRMDTTSELDAYQVVNTYSEERLADIIFRYGEEKFARKIARLICERRTEAPLETTLELVDIIKRAIPEKFRQKGSHPAKRTFRNMPAVVLLQEQYRTQHQ